MRQFYKIKGNLLADYCKYWDAIIADFQVLQEGVKQKFPDLVGKYAHNAWTGKDFLCGFEPADPVPAGLRLIKKDRVLVPRLSTKAGKEFRDEIAKARSGSFYDFWVDRFGIEANFFSKNKIYYPSTPKICGQFYLSLEAIAVTQAIEDCPDLEPVSAVIIDRLIDKHNQNLRAEKDATE